MRKSRFTVEQIAMALRQGEAGTPVAEIIYFCGRLPRQFTTLQRPADLWEPRQLLQPVRAKMQIEGLLTGLPW